MMKTVMLSDMTMMSDAMKTVILSDMITRSDMMKISMLIMLNDSDMTKTAILNRNDITIRT